MQLKLLIGYFLCMLFMCQCQSTTCISLLCNDPNVDIYVEDEYVGRNLVQYTLPAQMRSIQVECKKNGESILKRNIYVERKSKNRLYDLNVSENMKYSSSPIIHKSQNH